jgi:hypothetical protein
MSLNEGPELPVLDLSASVALDLDTRTGISPVCAGLQSAT